MAGEELYRVLFLRPGPVPPRADPALVDVSYLSDVCRGDVLQTSWPQTEQNNPKQLEIGSFTFHFTYIDKYPSVLRFFLTVVFFLYKGLALHFGKQRYDLIVSYGTTATGVAGFILRLLTGAKLIVEISGNPAKTFLVDSRAGARFAHLQHFLADVLLFISTFSADRLRLFYPQQVDPYAYLKNKPRSVFHELTFVSQIKPSGTEESYIYFLGGPWYLKGV